MSLGILYQSVCNATGKLSVTSDYYLGYLLLSHLLFEILIDERTDPIEALTRKHE